MRHERHSKRTQHSTNQTATSTAATTPQAERRTAKQSTAIESAPSAGMTKYQGMNCIPETAQCHYQMKTLTSDSSQLVHFETETDRSAVSQLVSFEYNYCSNTEIDKILNKYKNLIIIVFK